MTDSPKEKFKPVGADDVADFLRLMRGFYEEENYAFNENTASGTVSEFLAHPEWGRLWFVEVEGQNIGYLALSFGFNFEHGGRVAYIDEFYILKEYRSRGLGRRAMNYAEEQAVGEGCHTVHLEVERKNKSAERLFLKRGYHISKRKLLSKSLAEENDEIKGKKES